MSSFFKNPAPCMTRRLDHMKPLIHTLPSLEDMNLTKVENSEVVCRVCRGQRIVIVRSIERNKLTSSYCFNCRGSGTMTNREINKK